MELITQRLKLREFTQGDYAALHEMDCFPEMHTFEREMPGEEYTQQRLDEFIHNQIGTPRTTYILAITIPPQDQVIGLVKLSRQWDAIREWEVGWAVHPHEWGKGYAVEAARAVISWAFSELKIHRVVAFCHAENRNSVRVMEKLGMHRDGRLRETRWLNGRWWDEYVYGVLEREWKSSQ